MDIMELRTRLEEAPRIPLGVWPTPFMQVLMDGLRAHLRGDRMPPALDQTRGHDPSARREQNPQLEHVLAKARAGRCRRAAEHGEVQSNQVVQTAAQPHTSASPANCSSGRTDPRSRTIRKPGTSCSAAFRGSGASRTAGRRPGRGHAPPGRGAEGRRAASYIIPRGSITAEGRSAPALLLSCSIRRKPAASTPDAIAVGGQFGHHGGVPRRRARPCPFGRAGHPPLRLRHFRY